MGWPVSVHVAHLMRRPSKEIHQVFEWVIFGFEAAAPRTLSGECDPTTVHLMLAEGSRDSTGVYDALQHPVWRQLGTVLAVRERAGQRR